MSYGDLPQILRTVAQVIDTRDEPGNPHNFERRRLSVIRRLLSGERPDAGLLNYNLESFHVGIVVAGPEPRDPFRDLRGKLSSRLLLVEIDDLTAWGWLGGGQQVVRADLASLRALEWPEGTAVACGEPAQSLAGWRLTHRQAAAALPIAKHRPGEVTHYPDVALLAAALQDDLLSTSLRQTYLDPLEEDRDGGLAAKDTLRAYFKACRNASSAAADLGVNRATIRNRLDAIEERLGRSPDAASAELEVALRLDEVTSRDNTWPEVAIC
jgi:hypothetical protein